ncbi:shikimate kinase [Xylophilus sp. GW821-FHT01B05]
MIICLVGLPGSGKSTVGRQLARRLQVPFADSDHVIEEQIGGSIREFFEREGESAFRDIEAAVLQQLVREHRGVLATGGGAVLRPENRACLRQAGQVVYLRSSPEDLYRRLRHDRNRPLLQVDDQMARLRELFQARDQLYQEVAHFTLDTGRPSVNALLASIVMQLELSGYEVGQPPAGDKPEA